MASSNMVSYSSLSNDASVIRILPTQTIPIESLLDFTSSNINPNPNVITIYHLGIGSKVFGNDIKSTDPKFKRNHEFPQYIKNLMFNPKKQLSPEFIYGLSSKKINIRVVLILIDPYYHTNPVLEGLEYEMSNLTKLEENSHNIEDNSFKQTSITSILEPVVIPNDITEAQVLSFLKLLKHFEEFYPILVNIMDCSSITVSNLFSDTLSNTLSNTSSNTIDDTLSKNKVHITYPKCLLLDHETQYLPIITINNKSKGLELGLGLTIKKELNIRWINLDDDNDKINDLLFVSEYCYYSLNTFNLLKSLLKEYAKNYMLIGIYKLWTSTLYTNDYVFKSNFPYKNNLITINMSKISFEEFARMWKIHQGFRDLPIFNSHYDSRMYTNFIKYFINKYEQHDGISYMGIEPKLEDLLKLESHIEFTYLTKYFPDCKKYVSLTNETMIRNYLRLFLEENDVSI